MRIVIPAREGSKGLPHKNRKLFKYTASIIPTELREHTYVCTDDPAIIKLAREYDFNIIPRVTQVSKDTSSTKDVMKYVGTFFGPINETIVMLYLTYPQRTWEDVEEALNIFYTTKNKSLLCKKPVNYTPFLLLQEGDNNTGIKLIDHDLYRRQDYPKCFELSHFISIYNSEEIINLNNNMYNDDTYFIDSPVDIIDVDTQKDLDELDERFKRD
jgi:N-acylneuraminate cytidylyltransferase